MFVVDQQQQQQPHQPWEGVAFTSHPLPVSTPPSPASLVSVSADVGIPPATVAAASFDALSFDDIDWSSLTQHLSPVASAACSPVQQLSQLPLFTSRTPSFSTRPTAAALPLTMQLHPMSMPMQFVHVPVPVPVHYDATAAAAAMGMFGALSTTAGAAAMPVMRVPVHMSSSNVALFDAMAQQPPPVQPQKSASPDRYTLAEAIPASVPSEPSQRQPATAESSEHGAGPYVCSNCHTTNTPLWRRTPDRLQVLCNACGLYYKTYHSHRPLRLRHRKSASAVHDLPAAPAALGKRDRSSSLSDLDHSQVAVAAKKPNLSPAASPCSAAAAAPPMHTCCNCATERTSLWRRLASVVKAYERKHPETVSCAQSAGEAWLCNACALYYKLHGLHRPLSLARRSGPVKRRRRWDAETGPCEPPTAVAVATPAPPTAPDAVPDKSNLVNAVLRVLEQEGGQDAVQTWLSGWEMRTECSSPPMALAGI